MRVGLHSIVTGQCHAVLTEELAELVTRVSHRARFWQFKVLVVELKAVDIARHELGTLHVEVTEETSSFVHRRNVGTAYVGLAIPGLNSSVLPAIHLDHGHDIFDAHVLTSGYLGDLGNVLALSSKSLVQRLSKENVSFDRLNVFKQFERNWNELFWQKRRPVIICCVDPAVQEVMVAVWEALCLEEEVVCCFLVELSALFSGKRQPCDMEIRVFSLFDPVGPLGPLDSSYRPEARTL